MKRHWYSLLLAGSVVILAAVVLPSGIGGLSFGGGKKASAGWEVPDGGETATPGEIESEASGEGDDGPEGQLGTSSDGRAVVGIAPESSEQTGDTGVPESAAPSDPAEAQDLSDCLLIGDSRTVGLMEYGSLNEAEIFANSGMSTFNLFSAEETLRDGSKKTLEQLLTERSYRKIYLMLGINELGYPNSEVVKQYGKVVDKIQSLQPDAYVILEANLHVTKEKSESSPVYSNGKLDTLNYEIYEIASAKGCGYIDVNGLFDDGSGNMDAKYSSDGAHVMGKYYAVWSQWLREQQA